MQLSFLAVFNKFEHRIKALKKFPLLVSRHTLYVHVADCYYHRNSHANCKADEPAKRLLF